MTQERYKSKSWDSYFHDIGLREDVISRYTEYIQRLKTRGFPVIFEFNHLAQLLGRTPGYLASAVNAPEYHYRTFRIPKRKGGHREISSPYPALLACQQWINNNILSRVKIHKSAHGFVSGKSILTNAKLHLGQRCLLKIDLEEFFPSIKINYVIKIFRNCGYPANVAFYLARLCCKDGKLPQGAATSPALSNIVAYSLDARLSGVAKKFHLKYTRYADDITFSGDRISINTLQILDEIIRDQGFQINREKTHLCRSKGKRIVTGLSVANDRLRVPREYKRKIKQEIYYTLKYGYFSHLTHKRIREPFYLDSIYGKLQFWRHIEPDDRFANKVAPNFLRLIRSFR